MNTVYTFAKRTFIIEMPYGFVSIFTTLPFVSYCDFAYCLLKNILIYLLTMMKLRIMIVEKIHRYAMLI